MAPTRRVAERQSTVDAFAHNEVTLLFNILAYEVAHAGRCLLEAATKESWSLRRFRERVLRAAARVVVSGRRVTMIIGEAFARSWQPLWPQLERLRYADPQPPDRARIHRTAPGAKPRGDGPACLRTGSFTSFRSPSRRRPFRQNTQTQNPSITPLRDPLHMHRNLHAGGWRMSRGKPG